MAARAIWVLLAAAIFSACGGKSGPLVPSGTSGQDGSVAGTGAAGVGAAGTSANADAGQTYPAMSVDGKCVEGAFPRDGSCMCQPDVPLVCTNGCTNVDTDNDNCGGCDNRCGPTSTCVAGTCGPTPVTVVPAAAGCTTYVGSDKFGLSIAVSGGTLYVADAGHGTVTSRPVGGGAATKIASGEMAPHALAVAGTAVVWINSVVSPIPDAGFSVVSTGALRRAVGGGEAVTLAGGVNEAGRIAGVTLSLGGDTVYYSTNTTIMSLPIGGGNPTLVGSEDFDPPGPLALDGSRLVFSTQSDGYINVIALETGKVAECRRFPTDPPLVSGCARLGHAPSVLLTTILASANRVYWADRGNIVANDSGLDAVWANDAIAQSPYGDIRAMAMTPDRIYFAHDDVIERTPLTRNSTAQPIARNQKTPASVAVDATRVYWGNDGDCSVAATDL